MEVFFGPAIAARDFQRNLLIYEEITPSLNIRGTLRTHHAQEQLSSFSSYSSSSSSSSVVQAKFLHLLLPPSPSHQHHTRSVSSLLSLILITCRLSGTIPLPWLTGSSSSSSSHPLLPLTSHLMAEGRDNLVFDRPCTLGDRYHCTARERGPPYMVMPAKSIKPLPKLGTGKEPPV